MPEVETDEAVPDVSIVVPAHDEAGTLMELVGRIMVMTESRAEAFEVIVVDDGSSDGSAQILASLLPDHSTLRFIRLAGNQGQTAALAAGIGSARGPIVVTLDADLQNHPEDIPALLSELDEQVDVVAGVRVNRRDAAARKLASRLANGLVRRTTGFALEDIGCTLRAYRASVLRRVPLVGDAHRLLLVSLALHGARIRQVEVSHSPRVSGTSHYGFGRIPRLLLDLVVVVFLKRYMTRPMHLFGAIGAAMVTAGLAIILTAVLLRLIAGISLISTPLLLMGTFLGSLGLIAVMLGLVTEILVRAHVHRGALPAFTVMVDD